MIIYQKNINSILNKLKLKGKPIKKTLKKHSYSIYRNNKFLALIGLKIEQFLNFELHEVKHILNQNKILGFLV